MLPLAVGLGALQGLSSLSGLLGADAARRRANAARQQAITDMSANLDQQQNQMYQRDRTNLLGATGLGGDAINSLGRNLGSAMAGAGVYNSSATAGALAQATGQTQANLGQLAGQQFQDQQSNINNNQRYLTGLRSNLANSQYGEAMDNLQGARSGLSSFLGTLGQSNLLGSGARSVQSALPRQQGGYGDQGGLSQLGTGQFPGENAGASGYGQLGGRASGAIGTYNPNAFGGSPFGQNSVLQGVHAGAMRRPMYGVGGYNPNGY